MGDHLAISVGLLQTPLNPFKPDVSRGPPGLSGRPGPFGPHRNSTTACYLFRIMYFSNLHDELAEL